MILWIDAQLSPHLAIWIRRELGIEAHSVQSLGFRDAEDADIFAAAREAAAVVLTKDRDFVDLVEVHGPPPQVVWITCGNTSNQSLRRLLEIHSELIMSILRAGEPLVEIGDSMARAAE